MSVKIAVHYGTSFLLPVGACGKFLQALDFWERKFFEEIYSLHYPEYE